ncbi:MAG: hypothetical protein IH593_08565, partial [Bacteroidales bacterium]|nr:hypothetical protein [Bacteroidales bacterium]
MKTKVLPAILAIFLIVSGCADKQASVPSVIPQPVQVTTQKGSFTLKPSAVINYSGSVYSAGVASYLAEMLGPATGFALKTEEGTGGSINLVIDTTL